MKICVINGSPRGEYSITLQTVLYLQKCYPIHAFEYIHAARKLPGIEKDPSAFLKKVEEAELLLFAYPVYTFLVPSQLHRIVELIKASGIDLAGKAMSQITTSKHFYDVTAHAFLEENMRELGMRIFRGLSADMDDLTKEKGQIQAAGFFEHLIWEIEDGALDETLKAEAKKLRPVMIVTDAAPEDAYLKQMIRSFREALPMESHVVNLNKVEIKGGCLGCFNCATDGICIYKDQFQECLRKIQSGSAIVYAFRIKDHSMGALFKRYDDRQFCNGHRTVTMGKPFGYLIEGAYEKEINLRTVVEARAQVGGNYLAGVAACSKELDQADAAARIRDLAGQLTYALVHQLELPANFYGVGGMKIFRDLIYMMRGMMKADHRFYKAHGQYDFPQKKKGTIAAMYLVGWMLGNPKIKKKLGNQINEGMVAPYKKVLDQVKGDTGDGKRE